MVNVILCLCSLVGVCGFVMLVRNNVVYNVRTRASNEDYEESMNLINALDLDGLHQRKRIYDQLPSYDRMMFMFHKWTYEQFTGRKPDASIK